MCAGNVTEEEFERFWIVEFGKIATIQGSFQTDQNPRLITFCPVSNGFVAVWATKCGGLPRCTALENHMVDGQSSRRNNDACQIMANNVFILKLFSFIGPHESEGPDEMKNLFPIFYSQQKFIVKFKHFNLIKFLKKFDPNKTLVLEGYAQDCCKFDDPQRWKKYKNNFIHFLRVKFSKFKQKYVKIAVIPDYF